MNATALVHSADDDFDVEFSGCTLTHIISITTCDQLDIAITTLTAIRASGATLNGMYLTRSGNGLHQKVKVTGIKPGHARDLAGKLAALPGVTRAAVEHTITHQSS